MNSTYSRDKLTADEKAFIEKLPVPSNVTEKHLYTVQFIEEWAGLTEAEIAEGRKINATFEYNAREADAFLTAIRRCMRIMRESVERVTIGHLEEQIDNPMKQLPGETNEEFRERLKKLREQINSNLSEEEQKALEDLKKLTDI